MSSHFTFEGNMTIQQSFKIELVAKNYEEAAQYAKELIEDPDELHRYAVGNPTVEAEIDTYEELIISPI